MLLKKYLPCKILSQSFFTKNHKMSFWDLIVHQGQDGRHNMI